MPLCRWTAFQLFFSILPVVMLTACSDGGSGSDVTPSYTITTTSGSGGRITPDSISVKEGESAELIAIFDEGYGIDSVSGCDGTLSGNTYTTGPVTADCTVSASFVPHSYSVIGTSSSGGSISPVGSLVDYGSTATLMLTPDTGYEIVSAEGCGGTLSGNTYTTGPITADCTVSAGFAMKSFTVTGTAGSGGSISLASNSIGYGSTTTFTVTPDTGYAIDSVSGCGGTLAGDTYTTAPIVDDCTVSASFGALYHVGGSVSGLNSGNEVVLSNNGGDVVTVSDNTGFTFPTSIIDGGQYSINVVTQPLLQECSVNNGNSTVSGAEVTNVSVSCVDLPPDAPTVSLDYGIKTLQFSWDAVPRATYYRLLENPDGVSGFSVVADNLTTNSVSHEIALYNRINARYLVEACNNGGCTDALEILMANHLVDAIGYLKASNPDGGNVPSTFSDYFGYSVSLSADGNTLAVGAYGEDSSATGVDGEQDDNSAWNSGAVYVFSRSGTTWSQQAYLKASNTDDGDLFGKSVSLSYDGATLAVGAHVEDSSATGVNGDQSDNNTSASGAVYVFGRSGSTWTQQAYLKASNTGAFDRFGASSCFSADGNILAVGATYEDSIATGVNGYQEDNSALDSGAVYVFSRNGTTWSQQAYLKASNTGAGDVFGWSVSLSSDGTTLAVGAISEDGGAAGVNGDQGDNSISSAGAVYVFSRIGTNWNQQAYIKASYPRVGDNFGMSVSLSSDGSTMAVGAYGEDSSATGVDGDQSDRSAIGSGAVFVFARSGALWSQDSYLKASNTEVGDHFGWSVSLSSDGTTLAVGATGEDSSAAGLNSDQSSNGALNSGAAYVFVRNGGAWGQRAYLKALSTDAEDDFGNAVSLSSDGTTLAVGGRLEDSSASGVGGDSSDNGKTNSGAVYLY